MIPYLLKSVGWFPRYSTKRVRNQWKIVDWCRFSEHNAIKLHKYAMYMHVLHSIIIGGATTKKFECLDMAVDGLVWLVLLICVRSYIESSRIFLPQKKSKNTVLLFRSSWNFQNFIFFPMATIWANFNTIGQAIRVPPEQIFSKINEKWEILFGDYTFFDIKLRFRYWNLIFRPKNEPMLKFKSIGSKIGVPLVQNMVIFLAKIRNLFERYLNFLFDRLEF